MLKRITLKEQAYDYIKNMIFTGEMKTDTIYSEPYFAELLGTSRTPIREAILQLSQEGFLVVHLNKGVSIKVETEEEIRHLFEYRLALDGYCCMFAAEKCTTPQGIEFLSELEEIIAAGDIVGSEKKATAEFMKYDTAFHLKLAAFTGNPLIYENTQNLRMKIEKTGLAPRIKGATEEHKQILEAIRTGDSLLAYNAIKNHLNSSMEAFLQKR